MGKLSGSDDEGMYAITNVVIKTHKKKQLPAMPWIMAKG